ncbi:MAG: hypothetical protein AB4372_35630 [Xenococcus sp. (in: cyanobacteria)]
MSKTLLYRIFQIGKIPKDVLHQIKQEGILLQDEGIGGSVTFRKFRAPGKYYGWKRSWFSGSIVLTREHFLAFKYSEPIIGVPWNNNKIKKLNSYLDNEHTLCVEFEASIFRSDCSGDIKVRFSTPLARSFLEIIERNTY